MEIVIFIGAQAAGKSSFCKNRFFESHVRVNLDMLRTRNRERILVEACLLAGQPFVVDNTNATRVDRERYIGAVRNHSEQWNVRGIYFQSRSVHCIRRNRQRGDANGVSELAIRGTVNRLELPSLDEGFDQLNFVRIENNQFVVEEWKDEV